MIEQLKMEGYIHQSKADIHWDAAKPLFCIALVTKADYMLVDEVDERPDPIMWN